MADLKPKSSADRLFFIDVTRSISILLMLEGHFIVMWLDQQFKDKDEWVYSIFSGIRGNTAPLFLTITGVVFMYLLERKGSEIYNSERVKKGLIRVATLLGWAYLVQINFRTIAKNTGTWTEEWAAYTQEFHYNPITYFTHIVGDRFYTFHILHCIAIGLFLTIGIYAFAHFIKKMHYVPHLLVGAALACIFMQPVIVNYYDTATHLPYLPNILNNFFGGEHSVFGVFPFCGYVLGGAFIGSLIARGFDATSKHGLRNLLIAAIALIVIQALFRFSFDAVLSHFMDRPVKFFRLMDSFFLRFSLSLVLVMGVILATRNKTSINSTLLAVGQNTLPIFILHLLVLYGAVSGFGLDTILTAVNVQELESYRQPWITIGFAAVFIGIFVVFAAKIDALTEFYRKFCNTLFLRPKSKSPLTTFKAMSGMLLIGFVLYQLISRL
ncbi:MAG: hypothetical protein RL632_70 [Bacteroidota bacterium]